MGLDADFLSMLTAHIDWEPKASSDQWGNESYGPPIPVNAFVSAEQQEWGKGAIGNQQDNTTVVTRSVITDALGIAVGDRLTIGGATYTVTGVTTEQDEFGDDLYQSIAAENQKKG